MFIEEQRNERFLAELARHLLKTLLAGLVMALARFRRVAEPAL
jgi:hypothetical protein